MPLTAQSDPALHHTPLSLPVLDGIKTRDQALLVNGGKPIGDLSGALLP